MSSTTPSTCPPASSSSRENGPCTSLSRPANAAARSRAGLDRIGIAVDRDDVGAGREQRSACSRLRRRCRRRWSAPARGLERGRDLVEEDRNVAGRSANGVDFPAVARHHSVSPAGRLRRACRSLKACARASRAIGLELLRLPYLEEIAAPDEGHIRRDAGVLADEIADRDAAVLVELQEGPVAMAEERHVVRRLQERVLQRDPLLVAVEQIQPADVQRRHVERPQRIELRIAALLQHRTEMRRHGDPSLRIDPVHRTRQKPVHHSIQPLAPPRPSPSLTSAPPKRGP